MEESTAATGGWKGLPFYKRVTIVGLLVEAVLLLVIGILVAATGDPGVSVFLGIFVVPSAVIAWLLWKYERRVLIAAVVWTILSLLAALVFLLPALAYPNSFFDFGFAVPIIVSLLLAVVGSIVSVVQRRRGTARTESTRRERRVLGAITAVVVGLMVLSAILHAASVESVSAENKVGAIRVAMKEVKFVPDRLEIRAGETVRFVVKNKDLTVHTFTIKKLDIDVTVVPGAEKLIEPSSLAAGTYEYTCEVPGHDDMKGTLVVQ